MTDMKHFALFVVILLCGCASISENAANIQIHNQMSSLLDKCTKVGPIVGVGSCFWSHERGEQNARIDIREKAVGKGDTVVLLHTDHLGGEARIQGILFNCYAKSGQ